jgi:serine/threonine-protein kinase
MIGKLLGGRYRVVEILAAGGFSQTYIAEDSHRPSNPRCVVKHLMPASSDPSFLQNARRLFQAEAETLENLDKNDQIPRLLAHFEENQEFYLVQDFIAGHPLSNELPLGHRWSESSVVQLLQEVLVILEFVHCHELIHRDVKPSNLIRRQQDNRLVLIDFGSVKQAWRQVVTATTGIPTTIAIGTPGYIPTEQGRGKPRPNSDIYALGMIGIQALTGLHPIKFQEDAYTGEVLWQQHAQVSDVLALILSRMVRYHFKDRYQTAAEVLEALQPLINICSTIEQDVEAEELSVQQPLIDPAQVLSLLPQPEALPHQKTVLIASARTADTRINSQATSPATANCFSQLPLPAANSASNQQPEFLSPNVVPNTATSISSATQLDLPANYSARPSSRNQSHLIIGASITALLLSIFAGYTIYWQPRTKISSNLEQVENLKAAGQYQQCIAQAIPMLQDAQLYTNAQALLHECQFAQAKQLAAEKNFPAAFSEANKLPQTAAQYQEAQQLIEQWFKSILEAATNQYQSGKLNDAIATVEAVPATSPVYQQAQEAIQKWQQEWDKNNSYLQTAQNALNTGNWQQAISTAKKVRATPYWQQQITAIVEQAEAKIAASKSAVTNQPTSAIPKRASTPTNPKPVVSTTPRQSTLAPPRKLLRTTHTPGVSVPRKLIRPVPPKASIRTNLRRTNNTATPRGLARLNRKPVSQTNTTKRQNGSAPSKRSPGWRVETR